MAFPKTVAKKPKTALGAASVGRRWKAGILVALGALTLCSILAPSVLADTSTATPQVVSLGYSPSSVDVTDGSAAVTFTAHLTDSSDIQNASISLQSRSTSGQSIFASFSRTSGTAQDGTWQATVNLPQGAAAGAWDYSGSVSDGVNHQFFSETSYSNQNLPATAPGPLSVTDSSPSAAPQVVSLGYSPSSVDVTDGSAAVTFTAHLTDSSDIQNASISLQSRSTSGQSIFASFSRTSGTAQDGTWQATVNLPQGAAAGAWDYSGSVSDGVNHQFFSETSYSNQNLPATAPGPLSVTDSSPSAAPQVVSLGYSPSSVDVTDGSAAVTFTAHLTDSSDIQNASISLQSRSTSGQSIFASFSRTSGTAQDGTWQATVNLPQGAAAGAWDYSGSVSDGVNHQFFSETSYSNQNLPATAPGPLTVTDAHEPPPASSSAPSISGDAVEGQTLSESHGSWSGDPTSYSYQWQSCDGSGSDCSAIPGATDHSYTLTAGDVGQTIRVLETATNAGGSSSPATSAHSTAVEAIGSGSPSAAPQVVSLSYGPSSVDVTDGGGAVTFTMHLTSGHDITYPVPSPYISLQNEAGTQSAGTSLTLMSGTAQDGVWQGTVTIPRGASAGNWYYQGNVSDDLSNVSFSNGPGAPQNLPASAPGPLTVTDSSPSAAPQVVSLSYGPSSVDVTDGGGAVTFTMHLTSGHDITYPVPSPYISLQNEAGTQSAGTSLTLMSGTAQDGVWQGTVTIPRGASAGNWYYQGNVSDDLSNVSFSNGPGAPQNLPASAPGPLTVTYDQAPPPSSSGAPLISGDAVEGQTLSESHASWSGSPTSYSYQWQSCDGSGGGCSAIPGATGHSYTLTAGDVGHTIRVQETATNAGGTSAPAASATTATVVPVAPSSSGAPLISGDAVEGQTLSESHASWSGSPTSYSYQWQSCDGSGGGCSAIPGATGHSYTLTAGDVGHTIRVQETATNAGGTSAPAASATTATVVPVAPSSSGAPLISGDAVEGQTLSESHASWSGSPTSYSYQWQSCDGSGGGCSAIPGATGHSYTLTAGDVGHTIRVQETATNAGGSSSPATSAQTAMVEAIGSGSPSTSPQVVSLSYSPSSVNVTNGSAAVTLTMHLTDSSDIQNASIQLQSRTTSGQSVSAFLSRVSGTAQDGTWQATISLPQGAAAGAWDYYGSASDGVNHLYFSENSSGNQNLPAAAPGPLTVTDSSPSTPPQVVSLSYSPSSVNVTNGSAAVTLTMHLTDSSDIQNASIQLQSRTTSGQSVSAFLSRVSGTAQDGTWQATISLPQGAAAGAWDYYGSASDGVNHLYFSENSSGNQNLPAAAPGPLTVTDSSPSTPPQVVSLSYSPSSVNVTNGSAAVTLTMHLTDSSDIQNASIQLQSRTTSGQSVSAFLSRVSGTAQDGTWQATISLPQGAAAGAWDYYGSASDGVNHLYFSENSSGNQNLPAAAPGPLTVTDAEEPPPASSSAPSISGDALEGQTLSESHASWSGSPTSYSYQWQSCDGSGSGCSAIPGATGQSYTLTAGDVGHTIRVQETATNAGGAGLPATSSHSTVVQASHSDGGGSAGGGDSGTSGSTGGSGNGGTSGTTGGSDSSGTSGSTGGSASSGTGGGSTGGPATSGPSGPATTAPATAIPTFGTVKTSGAGASLSVACRGSSGASCTILVTLTVDGQGKRLTVLGRLAVRLAVSHRKTVTIGLNGTAKRLLNQHHHVTAKLIVIQNRKTILQRVITFRGSPSHH